MEDNETVPAAAFFRAICLATSPAGVDHEDACPTLSALAKRGWSIDVRGHQRAGVVVVTISRGADGKT